MNSTDDIPVGADVAWKPFLIRCAQALVCLIPFAYLGLLLATAAHEVLGHGLAAVCLGGRFLTFQMDLSGMGWAWTMLGPDSAAWQHTAVLSAGVVATVALGILFLVLGALIRRPLPSLILLVLSLNLLLEGAPYVFWNAVHPVPPGDIGRIISETSSAVLRPALIVAGGIVMFGAIWTLTALLFRRLEGWIGSNGRLIGVQRAVVVAMLGLVPAVLWFTFDWDELAPGLGYLPSVIGAASHLIAAASVFWIRFRPSPAAPSTRGIVTVALCGYAGTGAVIAAILIWLCPN